MLQIADGPVELPLNLTLWARLGKTIRMGRKSSAATLLKPTFQRRSELQSSIERFRLQKCSVTPALYLASKFLSHIDVHMRTWSK